MTYENIENRIAVGRSTTWHLRVLIPVVRWLVRVHDEVLMEDAFFTTIDDYEAFLDALFHECEKDRDEQGLEWTLIRLEHENPHNGETREFRHTVRVTGMREHSFGITDHGDGVPYSDCPCKPLYSVSEDDVTIISHQPIIGVVQ